MQTIAVFTAPTGGIIKINGRFAGETGPDMPLITPVTPNGILYVEFTPFLCRFRPTAHRFSITGGEFDVKSADAACYMILWPGGICEFAITPPAAYPPESEFSMMDGRSVAILRGEAAILRVGGNSVALPVGAQLPDMHVTENDTEIYMGACPEGRYAAIFSAHDLAPVEAITASTIEREENGILRTKTLLNDTVGHVLVEAYRPSATGMELVSSEYDWATGGPTWPDSPEKTAIAAVEAALLGLDGEATGYISPAVADKGLLNSIAKNYDAVLPMKYQVSGALPAVGLVKKLTDRAATVTPLRYHAIAAKGQQGMWRLDQLELE